MKREPHRGTIIGLYRGRDSGIALLGIEDDRRGKVLIPCDGNPTCRALDAAFPGTLIGGHTFNNDGIAGERIYYTVTELGVLESFLPVEEAPPEVVEEYEKAAKKRPSARKSGHIGFVEPDDPRMVKSPDGGGCTVIGSLPPDHKVFRQGPMVAGRPILQPPKRKPSEYN